MSQSQKFTTKRQPTESTRTRARKAPLEERGQAPTPRRDPRFAAMWQTKHTDERGGHNVAQIARAATTDFQEARTSRITIEEPTD